MSGEVPRERSPARFVRGTAPPRPEERQRARAAGGTATLATLLRERGYHVAFKGKWHLSQAGERQRLDRRATPSGSSATTASPTGSRPTPAATRRRRPSAAATPAPRTRAGTRTTRARWSAGSRRPDLPEPFCLVVSLVNPHDVLGYPSSYVAGRVRARGLPRPRRAAAADRRRGPARQADGPLADEARPDRVHRRAQRPRGPAGLRELLRLPAPGGGREDRPPAAPRSATPPIRGRCAHAR